LKFLKLTLITITLSFTAIYADGVDKDFDEGVKYDQGNNLDAAIAAYQKSIANNPNNADAYNNMGADYLAQSKIKEAIDAFKKACDLGNSAGCENYNSLKGD